jgi:acetoin utilization deacetylase AcuC-like enzyme
MRPVWTPAEEAQLLAVHDRAYLEQLAAITGRGGGQLDADTVVSPSSYDVARLAAGAACDAVRRVVTGDDSHALCLSRPPGHHALQRRAMGFCLLGNVAVAARFAIDQLGLDRVLIVDWDVHHGNGTQDMFYDDDQAAYFSIHRWPFYPGTGADDETGAGAGLGFTRNLPTAFGTPRREQLSQFAGELADFAAHVKPQLVIISAGFDGHALDPIGSLGLETEDFGELTRAVLAVADDHCHGRVVSVLEGGYNPPVLADCVALHLEGLMGSR